MDMKSVKGEAKNAILFFSSRKESLTSLWLTPKFYDQGLVDVVVVIVEARSWQSVSSMLSMETRNIEC